MVLIILEKLAISMVYKIATNGFDSRWGRQLSNFALTTYLLEISVLLINNTYSLCGTNSLIINIFSSMHI